jgi:hypothetical protein
MIRQRLLFSAFAAVLTLGMIAPAFAAGTPAPTKARFSNTAAYTGQPALSTTVAMIVAGGGPAKFDSVKLISFLAGDLTSAEVSKLDKQFGADHVKSFLTVFTFVVDDAVSKVVAAKVPLPTPDPAVLKDGKSLSAALYTLGVVGDTWNVEYMLDNLVTHPIHVAVMDDIDAKYGSKADANYHIVLTQAMLDLKAAYKL